jgi:phospholipid transport system substrate-binding protein
MYMAQSKLSRRGFIVTSAAFAATPSFALTASQAEKLVDQAVAAINQIIASNKSEAVMFREFDKVFGKYADVNIIALTTLGPARRSASKAQINAYVSAFRSYFTRKYSKRFNEFVGGEIIVQGAKPVKSYIEVGTVAKLRGVAPFSVDWHISDKSGKPKIFNIIIEGVNTLTSERIEMNAMLDKRGGNLDKLIADLKTAG